MSPKTFAKCATATMAAAACMFVMSSVRAGELDDAEHVAAVSKAFYMPFSAPCHPSFDRGACLGSARVAWKSDTITIAQVQAVPSDAASAPCHPAAYRGACLKHGQRATESGTL